jgi:ATP-binding cassette, subfamily B, bacterial
VLAWAALDAVDGPLVVGALGFVVGAIPDAVRDGMSSPAGHRLIGALVIAALLYTMSLVLDPVGGALSTASRQRITGQLQARLLTAVNAPAGVAHLEDQETLDRLASAEGSLTGYFPGDAPVTWVGAVAGRLSGVIGCVWVAAYIWWLGLLLLIMWLAVRRVIVASVLRQAIDMRGQTTAMRRAWYFTGVGSKARDAKEVRVFGLARFLASRHALQFTEAIRAGHTGLRGLHRRAVACFAAVVAGNALAIYVITDAARTRRVGPPTARPTHGAPARLARLPHPGRPPAPPRGALAIARPPIARQGHACSRPIRHTRPARVPAHLLGPPVLRARPPRADECDSEPVIGG